MATELDFKSAWTHTDDTRVAFEEVRECIAQPSPACVFFYCSPKYNLEVLARLIQEHYDCPVLACTTAGEVVPGYGYVEDGMAAGSLASPHIQIAQESIPDVRSLDSSTAMRIKERLLDRLCGADGENERCFGMLLIDGLCEREEFVAATVYGALGGVPIIGGSAGEAGALKDTYVLADGQFRTGAATLTLFRTTLPFLIFKTDNFEKSDTRFVVTRAEPEKRRLLEINGMSPAQFYLERTGITRPEFNALHAARHPLLLPVGSDHYARGVMSVSEDGCLNMFCAIEEGIVLRMGVSEDIVADLERQRQAIEAVVPNHHVTLGFDCFYRRLEVIDRNLREVMRPVVDNMNLFAFNTYGEQYNGLHINQTLTGVALGTHG